MLIESRCQQTLRIPVSNGEEIVNSAQVKILGVYLNHNHNLAHQINHAYKNAMYWYHMIRPALINMPDDKKAYAIKTFVLPILTYCLPLYIG